MATAAVDTFGSAIVPSAPDNSCLFNCLVLRDALPVVLNSREQVGPADALRQEICDYMLAEGKTLLLNNEDTLADTVLREEKKDLTTYVTAMRNQSAWGGVFEIECFAQMTGRCVRVYQFSPATLRLETCIYASGGNSGGNSGCNSGGNSGFSGNGGNGDDDIVLFLNGHGPNKSTHFDLLVRPPHNHPVKKLSMRDWTVMATSTPTTWRTVVKSNSTQPVGTSVLFVDASVKTFTTLFSMCPGVRRFIFVMSSDAPSDIKEAVNTVRSSSSRRMTSRSSSCTHVHVCLGTEKCVSPVQTGNSMNASMLAHYVSPDVLPTCRTVTFVKDSVSFCTQEQFWEALGTVETIVSRTEMDFLSSKSTKEMAAFVDQIGCVQFLSEEE
jgi:hypothetical protein